MAENDSSQEKTEEATPKKLEKAREEGQVPRSRELTTTAILLAGTIGLYIFGQLIAQHLMDVMRFNFSIERQHIFDTSQMVLHLASSFYDALLSLVPLFGILLAAAIIGPIALGGWLFSAKAMAPKFSRMNPAAGLKRMFSVKALMELAKALAKVLVILALAIGLLMSMQTEMLNLAYETVDRAIIHSMELSAYAAIALAAATILIAIVDIPFQIWEHTKKLKMSLQDIKDEMKDSEGKPEVKGRIRQLQREMANNRMMSSVPDADVVITNPTHYAVALKYDQKTMGAPVVVAKGADEVAFKIMEIARENKVEVLRTPPLTRAVYHNTDIGEEIPDGLYMAIAQVLAYVFQLRQFRKGRGPKPGMPDFPIPPDMRRDI